MFGVLDRTTIEDSRDWGSRDRRGSGTKSRGGGRQEGESENVNEFYDTCIVSLVYERESTEPITGEGHQQFTFFFLIV